MSDTTTTKPAVLDQEFVVANGFWWYRGRAGRALALPWVLDDITRDFGDDIYERMLNDAVAAACDTLMRASVAEEGFRLSPAVDEEDQDGYKQAVELVKFCEPQLNDLETSLDDVLWDLLGCMSTGNRVAEITYHPFDRSPLPGRAVLQSIAVKPREATAFVVDSYYRLLGFLGREVGQPLVQAGALVEPATNPNFLPREKFAVATFRPRNNDPRGTSYLRPAYNPWWLKMQTWQEYLKYLTQFASPSIVGKAAKNAVDTTDPATGQKVSALDALLQRLIAFQNGTALAVPADYEIDILFSTGEGKAFLSAFQLYNQEIAKAITTQTLATSEGEHASRAQAGVHQDALGTIVRQAKRALCRMLRRDVLRNLVRYNYGDKLAKLTPKVSLGEVEAEDEAKLITAFAQLQSSGYIHPSQQPGIDRRLNLPARVLAPGEEQGQGQQGEQGQQGQQGQGQQGQQAPQPNGGGQQPDQQGQQQRKAA